MDTTWSQHIPLLYPTIRSSHQTAPLQSLTKRSLVPGRSLALRAARRPVERPGSWGRCSNGARCAAGDRIHFFFGKLSDFQPQGLFWGLITRWTAGILLTAACTDPLLPRGYSGWIFRLMHNQDQRKVWMVQRHPHGSCGA